MISKLSYVCCDECGDPTEAVTGGAKEARREARRSGYVYANGLDICEPCRTGETRVQIAERDARKALGRTTEER